MSLLLEEETGRESRIRKSGTKKEDGLEMAKKEKVVFSGRIERWEVPTEV